MDRDIAMKKLIRLSSPWKQAAMLLGLFWFAPATVVAEPIKCQVFDIEPINSSLHRRVRVFVATESDDPDLALALGYGIAINQVEWLGYDFVIVFVTRMRDGLKREDHSMGTTQAVVKFNPGDTPVIKTRLEAQVIEAPVTELGELAILRAPRKKVIKEEVVLAYLRAREKKMRFLCLDRL